MNTKHFKELQIGKLLLFLVLLSSVQLFLNGQQKKEYTDSIIIHKTLPLISYIEKSPEVLKILRNNETLRDFANMQKNRIETAKNECKDVDCYASSVQLQDNEIVTIGNELISLYGRSKAFRHVITLLKSSGYYDTYLPNPDTGFIRAAWNNTATGINQVIDVYIKGKRPRYPAIDAISFDKNDNGFQVKIRQALEANLNSKFVEPFYKVSVSIAMEAMRFNGRDEASRYEPLNKGMNLKPYVNIRKTKWDDFPYSVILVPGQGPEKEGVVIDSMSIYRCNQAVQFFKQGMAPFIIVSGGHVHPNKTPYSEAVEMKRYLVNQLNIPEQAVFIEPHARHTTTNLRNASRIIYRFNIPHNKKVLIVTNSSQNELIQRMEKRCITELGYVPYNDLKKLSEETSEFYPVRNVLQCNSSDPLDP